MEVLVDWGFLEQIFETYYDQHKGKKASTDPREYQRGFDDGFSKGRLAACKELEDEVGLNVGKEFEEGFLHPMKHSMVNATFTIKGDPRLEFGEVEVRYGPGFQPEPLGREVVRFWGTTGDPKMYAHIFYLQQASGWTTKLIDSMQEGNSEAFNSGYLQMGFGKDLFMELLSRVGYPEFSTTQGSNDGKMEYYLWMNADIPGGELEFLETTYSQGNPIKLFQSVQGKDESVIMALERFAIGMRMMAIWYREYLTDFVMRISKEE